MNKKSLIELFVIIACFAASGIVIYNNFFKNSMPGMPTAATKKSANSAEQILPHGSDFNLDIVKQSGLQFNLIDYPKVKYPEEAGVDENGMLK